MARAVDPDRFTSAVNISQPFETYFVSYTKLLYLLEYCRPKIVILGFSHHKLSATNDQKYWDSKRAFATYSRIYPINRLRTSGRIVLGDYRFYISFFKNLCLYPHTNHFNFMGGYYNNYFSNLSGVESKIKNHYHIKNDLAGISKTSISYLNKIIDLCKYRNIDVLIVGTPVHSDYYNLIPDSIIDKYIREREQLIKDGNYVLDYTQKFNTNTLFWDTDHLNQNGANEFSDSLINYLSTIQLYD